LKNWLGTERVNCADVPTMLANKSTVTSRQLGWPGQQRQFVCSATALPLPTVTWSRSGGLFVVDSATYRVNTSTQQLTVTSTLQVTLRNRLLFTVISLIGRAMARRKKGLLWFLCHGAT